VDPITVAKYVGIFLGSAILLAVLYAYVRYTKLGPGGLTFSIVGVLLLGSSLYQDINFSPGGGIHLLTVQPTPGSRTEVIIGTAPEAAAPIPRLGPSRVSPAVYRITIINAGKTLKDSEIERAIGPLQTQITEHFTPIWGIGADLSFVPGQTKAPPEAWTLVILDEADIAGALAYHDVANNGFPLGKVFSKTAKESNVTWTVAASHQLLEMLVNPRINLTVFNSSRSGGTLYAYEVADACESDADGYIINDVLVSDFVYPSWFDANAKGDVVQFDYMGHIHKPLELCPGGYISAYDVKGGGWRQIFK
jgi:hypothetical protein